MAEKIKQNIFIYYSGGATEKTGFTFNISNVPFQPDTLIVWYINFVDGGSASDNLVLLYSDLVGNKLLAAFTNNTIGISSQKMDVYHKFNIIPQGSFTFNYITTAGAPLTLTGSISIQLEFSKSYY